MSTGRGQAVADDVADGDRDAVARQLGQVVPVAAHVEGADGGAVAHGCPVMGQRHGLGQHRGLEDQCHLTFTRMGPAQPFVDFL